MVATSHTPNTRPSRSVARGLRGRVRAHLLTDSRAGAFGRPSWVSGVRVGLVVLVGLTAWAVASISVWMVPAYLALMVLIFVMPQGRRPSKPASEPGTEPIRFGVFAIDKSLRVDRAAGSDHIRSVDEPLDSGLEADEAAIELSGSVPDSAGSEAVKPRRGRGRARKSAKAVAESAPIPPWPPGSASDRANLSGPIASIRPSIRLGSRSLAWRRFRQRTRLPLPQRQRRRLPPRCWPSKTRLTRWKPPQAMGR